MNIFEYMYESLRHTLRGIFGPSPYAGEIWEFAAKNEEAFFVSVNETTFLHVNFKYVDGNGTTHRLSKFFFRVCYRPIK